ncbi:MAG: 2'-5' RNA ligase family protein [Dehalococcoidia bacterium]
MALRMVSLLLDEVARREIDLVRALYDRAAVDSSPPQVPLVFPFDENTSTSDLADMIGLIVAVHQPFMLELAQPERFFDGDDQLLQFLVRKGADESQRLAGALYRDIFSHHRPDDARDTPLQRTALTAGRFSTQDDADRAVAELRDKSYFLVVTEVGILEADKESGWSVQRTLRLGNMIESGL